MKKKSVSVISIALCLMICMLLPVQHTSAGSDAEKTDPSKAGQIRAIWHQPKEKTSEEVEQAVQKIADAGFNAVFLNTVFNGYTIFPTDYEGATHNPDYEGFDVLQAYLDACHSRGMVVHAWCDSLFAGLESYHDGGPLIKQYPEWLLEDNAGNNYESTMYGKMYVLNPVRPECREWVIGLYKYVCERYALDGLQLDYVRYPEKTDSVDFGYDEYTLNAFKEAYGIDAVKAEPGSEEALAFVRFKQDAVTEFVRSCYTTLKSVRPDLIISVSVSPYFAYAESNYMQSARLWMKKGYADWLVPMAYYENSVADHVISSVTAAGRDSDKVVVGISAQSGFSPESLDHHAQIAEAAGCGFAVFEYEFYFIYEYDKVLGNRLANTRFFNEETQSSDPEVTGDNETEETAGKVQTEDAVATQEAEAAEGTDNSPDGEEAGSPDGKTNTKLYIVEAIVAVLLVLAYVAAFVLMMIKKKRAGE
ncbi:MAG: family 10 glycosylhydrolase [Lachnospiraceae bacterium]|nr:family 10 glycosylhydrolase [Lachnospiraceae bacterium]